MLNLKETVFMLCSKAATLIAKTPIEYEGFK